MDRAHIRVHLTKLASGVFRDYRAPQSLELRRSKHKPWAPSKNLLFRLLRKEDGRRLESYHFNFVRVNSTFACFILGLEFEEIFDTGLVVDLDADLL